MTSETARWITTKLSKHPIFEVPASNDSLDLLVSAFRITGPCLGIYKNGGDQIVGIFEDSIAVAGRGHIFRLSYDAIAGVRVADLSERTKTTSNLLEITAKDGSRIHLRIEGGGGRFRDIYAFHSFLQNVCSNWATISNR